jgi:hypothetical protein
MVNVTQLGDISRQIFPKMKERRRYLTPQTRSPAWPV